MNTTFISTSKAYLQRYILPSLTGRGWGVGLCLACLLLGACSRDDINDSKNATYTKTTVIEAPTWQIDWSYNQERPNWSEPDGTTYENWTILMVQIEEALLPFVSDGDMIALFVNEELRGLARPAINVGTGKTGDATFLMKAYGNEADGDMVQMTLQYYNQRLKHIFTLSDNIELGLDTSTGIDEDFIPEFTLGSAKYPVVKVVGVEGLLTAVGINPTAGNLLGAFAGEECRGKVTLSASGTTWLIIYGREAGESMTLKYYDPAREVMYTIADAVKL